MWEVHACPVLTPWDFCTELTQWGEALGGSVVHWEGHDALGPGAGQC